MRLNCRRYNENDWNIMSKFYPSSYPYKFHAKPLLFLNTNMPVKPNKDSYNYRKILEIVKKQIQ